VMAEYSRQSKRPKKAASTQSQSQADKDRVN
jgi:hypothetical protein